MLSPNGSAIRALRWAAIGSASLFLLIGVPAFLQQQNPQFVVALLAYLAVGALITRARPENAIGWVFLAVVFLGGLLALGNQISHEAFVRYVVADAAPPSVAHPLIVEAPLWVWWGAWLSAWPFYLVIDLATAWTFFLFPSGLQSPRWRVVFVVNAAAVAAMTALGMLRPYVGIGTDADLAGLCGPQDKATCLVGVRNVVSPAFMNTVELRDVENSSVFLLFGAIVIGCAVLSVLSVVLRFRRSRGIERLQMRWFVLAATLVFATYALSDTIDSHVPAWAGNVIQSLVVGFVPVACGIAILRYRLYDIDRVISRTAAYAIVTGALLVVYVSIVTSASKLVGSTSALAVAGATLAAAALFRPLLTRVQRVVDRRFNRERVDGQRAVGEFGSRLADEVDPARVCREFLDVTDLTLAPSSAALWLHGGSR